MNEAGQVGEGALLFLGFLSPGDEGQPLRSPTVEIKTRLSKQNQTKPSSNPKWSYNQLESEEALDTVRPWSRILRSPLFVQDLQLAYRCSHTAIWSNTVLLDPRHPSEDRGRSG